MRMKRGPLAVYFIMGLTIFVRMALLTSLSVDSGSRGRRKSNERRRRPAVTSQLYRMCGHLDAPFAFVSRARNITVTFHSDDADQASGFSIGYVAYSGTSCSKSPRARKQPSSK